VPPANTAALVTSVTTLLQDSDRRTTMGAAGRAYIEQDFSVAGMVAGNLQVYREIL